MAASVIEQILARAKSALLAGATAAGSNVFRGREDAIPEEQIPALNIKRMGSNADVLGANGERIVVNFEIEHYVAVTDDWETAADALHVVAHYVLFNDTQLAALGRGLRCTGTDAQGDSADRMVGRLTASYQMQVFVRPGDFTRSIN